MALTSDELIAISDLEKAQITDSSVVPDWVLPAEVRGSSAPINGIPYPQHTIDVFGGLLTGEWSLKFQNPLQRVVCDLENADKLYGVGCFRRDTSLQAGRQTQISGAVWNGRHPFNRDSTVNTAADQSGNKQGAIRHAEAQE